MNSLYVIFSIACVLAPICGEVEISNNDRVNTIDLAAIGRVAALGDLYDDRSERFIHISIFTDPLPKQSIQSKENFLAQLKYSYENTMNEKFEKLEISANLKLSIMADLFQLEGSGRFFKDSKRSAKSAKISVINSITTKYESISIAQNDIQSRINDDVLDKIDATHIVVGIQWGGNVFVSVEDTNIDNTDQITVQGSLKAKITYLANQISGNASVDYNELANNVSNHFNFEVYGDILPNHVPTNLVNAIKFMNDSASLLREANDGKGKAMKFSLIPVNILRSFRKLHAQINSLSNSINEATVELCVKLFDDMTRVQLKLNDFVNEVLLFQKHILTAKVENVQKLLFNYTIYQAEARHNLSTQLILVRIGNKTADKLEDVIIQANKHPYSWRNIEMMDFSQLKRELSFLKSMSKENIKLLDKDQSLQNFLFDNYGHHIYILFYNDEYLDSIPMENFVNMIMDRDKYGSTAIFASVKNEILGNQNETKISLYRNMKKMMDNFDDKSSYNETDPESWPISFIQTQLANLIKDQGFIYVQLANQSQPQTLWPKFEWLDITSDYAGLFFRAEGGNSNKFGSVQEENSLTISGPVIKSPIDGTIPTINMSFGFIEEKIKYEALGGLISAVISDYHSVMRKVVVSPRNSATRIWKRN